MTTPLLPEPAAEENLAHNLLPINVPRKFLSAGDLWNNYRFVELAPSTEKRIIFGSPVRIRDWPPNKTKAY